MLTIIGNGQMAFALANGLKNKYRLQIVGRDYKKLEEFEKKLETKVEKSLLNEFNIENREVILALKPANIENLKLKGEAKVIYSVLAGTSIEKIEQNIDTKASIRTMPNLGAMSQNSFTTLTGDINYKNRAIEIFSSIGEVLWLESEKEIDISTALTSSGVAFLSLVAEALMDGAVKQGLKREDAIKGAMGVFKSFSSLREHPAIIKDKVMSPAGTTAYGYKALEDGKVRASFIKAIEKAYNRAKEI